MRDPIRINLDYLASTYGIEPLGLAFIEFMEDGRRILVLAEVPESITVIDSLSIQHEIPVE